MKPTPYRTVFTVLMLACAVLAALWICLKAGEPGQKMFDTAAFTFFLLSLPQAAKSGIEHLAKGGGFRGAWKTLTTEAKPEQPETPK